MTASTKKPRDTTPATHHRLTVQDVVTAEDRADVEAFDRYQAEKRAQQLRTITHEELKRRLGD